MTTVVVIGAGVVGLSTAIRLLEHGYRVILLAKQFPSSTSILDIPSHDYSTFWAGANWLDFSEKGQLVLQNYQRKTLNYLKELSNDKTTGVMEVLLQRYCLGFKLDNDEDYLRSTCADWKRLYLKDVTYAYEHKSVTINIPKYCAYLLRRYLMLGGQTMRVQVNHINDVFRFGCAAVINCTGNGAKYLGGVNDLLCFPTRGQTCLVKTPFVIRKTITVQYKSEDGKGHVFYVIPRDDSTAILGGTMEAHNHNSTPSAHTFQMIEENCRKWCPEVFFEDGKLEILRHSVGFRPSRVGGIRCEVERRHDGKLVGHNYGHHSYGFQTSWATADNLVKKLNQQLLFNKSHL